jgi:hypothetical protein
MYYGALAVSVPAWSLSAGMENSPYIGGFCVAPCHGSPHFPDWRPGKTNASCQWHPTDRAWFQASPRCKTL